MKLLCFVDVHGDMKSLKKIHTKAKDADLLVGAGDFSIFGNKLEVVLDELDKIGKPVLVVSGNHEGVDIMEHACALYENIICVDRGVAEVGDYIFLGYGDGGFGMRDPEFKEIAKVFKKKMKGKKSILILHGPPHGFRVDKIHGNHAGNKDYTDFIKKEQPHLVISGHLHETAGQRDKCMKSVLINPGWEGVIVNV